MLDCTKEAVRPLPWTKVHKIIFFLEKDTVVSEWKHTDGHYELILCITANMRAYAYQPRLLHIVTTVQATVQGIRDYSYKQSRGRINRVKLRRCRSARHEGTWGSKVMVHSFITLVLDGGEWSPSSFGPSNPRVQSPRYPLNGS